MFKDSTFEVGPRRFSAIHAFASRKYRIWKKSLSSSLDRKTGCKESGVVYLLYR